MKSALVIDDDFDFREIFSLILAERDIAVWEAGSTEEAFQILAEEQTFDYIFCDVHLPFTLGPKSNEYLYSEEVGIRTISELKWVYQETASVIAMSAIAESETLELQVKVGDVPVLTKPVRHERLEHLLSLSPDIHSANGFEPLCYV